MGGYALRNDKLHLLGIPEGSVWNSLPLMVAALSCPLAVQGCVQSKLTEQKFRSQDICWKQAQEENKLEYTECHNEFRQLIGSIVSMSGS